MGCALQLSVLLQSWGKTLRSCWFISPYFIDLSWIFLYYIWTAPICSHQESPCNGNLPEILFRGYLAFLFLEALWALLITWQAPSSQHIWERFDYFLIPLASCLSKCFSDLPPYDFAFCLPEHILYPPPSDLSYMLFISIKYFFFLFVCKRRTIFCS